MPLSLATLFTGALLIISSFFAPVAHVPVNYSGQSAPIVPAVDLAQAVRQAGYSADLIRNSCADVGGTLTYSASEVSCRNVQSVQLACDWWAKARTYCENAGGHYSCDSQNIRCVV